MTFLQKMNAYLSTRLTLRHILPLLLLGLALLFLFLLNITPGHIGFADVDGCACGVNYTTAPTLAHCEPIRTMHCEYIWVHRFLSYISYLDFNK